MKKFKVSVKIFTLKKCGGRERGGVVGRGELYHVGSVRSSVPLSNEDSWRQFFLQHPEISRWVFISFAIFLHCFWINFCLLLQKYYWQWNFDQVLEAINCKSFIKALMSRIIYLFNPGICWIGSIGRLFTGPKICSRKAISLMSRFMALAFKIKTVCLAFACN